MPTIMVIDDSMSVRKVMERALTQKSFGVISAASGTEAIQRLEGETPDLVVCDVVMPDKDGYQICEFVRNHPRLSQIPVLLISGIVNSDVLDRAARVQSNGVLGKPFAADELLRRIDDLLVGSNGGAGDDPAPAATAAPAVLAGRAARPAPAPAMPEPPLTLERDVAREPMALEVDRKTEPSGAIVELAGMPGVDLVLLVDREGFVLESSAAGPVDADTAGALASCLTESSEGVGRHLERGALQAVILEFDRGTVLLHGVGAGALIVIVLSDGAALGKVFYAVKTALPELARRT
jgi:CheY-like chemotaxis protein/predicted regulator of Ras-like GTPase activity (Roadblock/LC7/MglB family)